MLKTVASCKPHTKEQVSSEGVVRPSKTTVDVGSDATPIYTVQTRTLVDTPLLTEELSCEHQKYLKWTTESITKYAA